jgi:hypothetical protein
MVLEVVGESNCSSWWYVGEGAGSGGEILHTDSPAGPKASPDYDRGARCHRLVSPSRLIGADNPAP